MRQVRAIAIGVVCAALAGCSSNNVSQSQKLACSSDDQCGQGELCFPEGCGDPGGQVVVEVTGDTRAGLHAQDLALGDGGVTPKLDFTLHGPALLGGEFQRNLNASGDPGQRVSYTDTVSVRVIGQSVLIPGLARTYSATFTSPERGTWSLPVGEGIYAVSAIPAELSVPPGYQGKIEVTPGKTSTVTFAFPSVGGSPSITGRVAKRLEGPGTGEVALTQVAMDIQAIEPQTGRPLSQRVQISSGNPGSRGDYSLVLEAGVENLPAVWFSVTPREAGALAPTKVFSVSTPLPENVNLELGDYGDPLPQVRGEIYGSDQQPIAGAVVYLQGQVGGGGTFRSRSVTTDDQGQFAVDLLPSGPSSAYTLVAVPPPGMSPGILSTPVRTVAVAGQVPTLEPLRSICPDRITVQVTILRPDGSLGRAVRVTATPIAPLKDQPDRPLPLEQTDTVSDESGVARLELDPGQYRFDFAPGEDLPQTSRVVTVRPDADPTAGNVRTVDLGQMELWKGRRVSGTVYGAGQTAKMVNATLRFFRVTHIGGEPSALPLGEALSDDSGNYSVVLPSR